MWLIQTQQNAAHISTDNIISKPLWGKKIFISSLTLLTFESVVFFRIRRAYEILHQFVGSASVYYV